MSQTKHRLRIVTALLVPVALAAFGYLGLYLSDRPEQTVIKTQELGGSFETGKVEGANASVTGSLKAVGALTYESPETETKQPKTNAISLQWEQTGGAEADEAETDQPEPVTAQVRTHDGASWTGWATLAGADDRKDGTMEAIHSAIVLTKNATRVQYRFVLTTVPEEPIEISNPKVVAIDATEGPDPDKKPGGLAAWLNVETAKAVTGSPRVLSRAEWGCPDPNNTMFQGDPDKYWPASYYPLNRVMVHHTAATGAGYNGAAGVRAVWYQHANTNNWGDIGYNYLVDMGGTIYEGRYKDKAYADASKKVAEGGHTLGYNRESIGISALGNFESEGPSGPMNEAISQIAGSQMAVRDLQPWATYTDVQGRSQYRLAGHRNYTSTACPGRNLYANLDAIRNRATEWMTFFSVQRKYDYSYVGQTINGATAASVNLRNGQTATFSIDLKNEGEEIWSNTGSTPIRIGTANPLGHNSSLAHSSWLAPSRPATFTQKIVNGTPQNTSTVAPGETARFTFVVQAPNATATVYPYYQLVAEGVTWFPRNVGIYFTVNMTADSYGAQWLDQSNTVPEVANTSGTLNLTLKNTSTTAWTNTGDANTVRLGTDRPKDRQSSLYHPSWQGQNRIASFAGKAQLNGSGQVVKDGNGNVQYDNTATAIQPGEAAYFTFSVRTPTATTHVNEYISPVVDGKAWMDSLGIYWPVHIDTGYHAKYAGQSAAPTIDKSDGGVGVMYFDFKNTGSIAWTKTGPNPIRLGTERPRDRSSGFQSTNLGTGGNPALPANTQNWLGPNRVQSFAGTVSGGTLNTAATSVQPGEIGRFMIALDGRAIPNGTYQEYFSPVVEGVSWLFFGTWLPITVQN